MKYFFYLTFFVLASCGDVESEPELPKLKLLRSTATLTGNVINISIRNQTEFPFKQVQLAVDLVGSGNKAKAIIKSVFNESYSESINLGPVGIQKTTSMFCFLPNNPGPLKPNQELNFSFSPGPQKFTVLEAKSFATGRN
jgi:hypothetical protein